MHITFFVPLLSSLFVTNALASSAGESLNLTGSMNNNERLTVKLMQSGSSLRGRLKAFSYDYPYVTSYFLRGASPKKGKINLIGYGGELSGTLVSKKILVGSFKSFGTSLPCLLRVSRDPGALGDGKYGIIITDHQYRIAKRQTYNSYSEVLVDLPIVSGLSNPKAIRKIQKVLSSEYRPKWGLSTADFYASMCSISYSVNYNKNYLLDLDIESCGLGAYLQETKEHFLIDLKTGKRLFAKDVFTAAALEKIRKMANERMQTAAEQQIIRWSRWSKEEHPDRDDELKYMNEEFAKRKFTLADLNTFVVGDRGITFRYDWAFPHVSQACEPNHDFFFSYKSLKPYIRKDSPLVQFVGNPPEPQRRLRGR